MNRKFYVALILQGILVCCFLGNVIGQALPGKRDSINSIILKEKRVIQVVLPEKYKPGNTDKYDVIYVLDGDWNTRLMTQVQQFIEGEGGMPSTIIVGVLNTDRNRDFLPTHVDDTKTSGGADKFLSFLKDELIPYVNKTYPADGDNILFGHSFGGVFVAYALLNEPQLFKSYIAADPSFWWDKHIMHKQIKYKLASLANLNKSFFITGREGEGMIGMGIPPVDSLLKKDAPAGLSWKVNAYPDETHGSVRLKSMYDGLKFSYAGYSPGSIQFHPTNGIILKDKPIKVWYFSDTSKIHYTTDGSEPTPASAIMKHEIVISTPGKVNLKQFSSWAKYDRAASGEFKAGGVLPSITKIKNNKPGGFHYAYYEGTWDKLPDFKTLKPVKQGITDSSFSIDKLPRQNNFALLIDGYVEIKEESYYIFGLDSDDGAKLYFNDQLLIDYDGVHINNTSGKSFILPLKKGFYPIRVEYFQKDGDRKLELEYVTPGNIEKKHSVAIPFELQYSKK